MQQNKRNTTILTLLCCAAALLIAKCAFQRNHITYINEDSSYSSNHRNVKKIQDQGKLADFESVEVEGNVELHFIYDKESKLPSYTISEEDLEENELFFQVTRKNGKDVLRIEDLRDDPDSDRIRIRVHSRKINLNDLSLSKGAAAKITIEEKWLSMLNAEVNKGSSCTLEANIDSLIVAAQDASSLKLSGDINVFHLKLTDASEATLSGSSKYLKASVLRASELFADTFSTDSVDLKLLNSSEALLCSDKVNKNDIDNSSKLVVSSQPKKEDTNTSTTTDSVNVSKRTHRL
ncbi:MAG: DUF2807 domain-containing protein [Porphyromonas sp.]|nr:DUF2807 domain-containing protein [Porphyromonas sp.]